ncbi:sigma-54-dependent Fis family transcriptional regulator [Candidatus Sumerlaeota bacterium]|nr:sigma-54-dependent Fis family transcriptional regulator [Candidatus Sumerlaeota bacterium]
MDSKVKVMVVEDEKNAREGMGWFLESLGYEPILVAEAESALKILGDAVVDVLLTDLKMPGMDGMQLLERVQEGWPELPTIMITAHGTVETAVRAMQLGAADYLNKPVMLDELRVKIEKALKSRSMERENIELRERVEKNFGFENIIGQSPAMQEVFGVVRQAANSRASILITGESGTGKELIAGALHQHSPRKSKPFVKVNCGALSETLLESELFGHEKGAFTHAVAQRAGRFELADGGSILLDEIGETQPEFQVKLLRVLQEGEFERVGGQDTIKTDVRIIAATNQDLERLVKDRKFREDLYYRLNVVRIHLPPLRERQEDVALLVNHFVQELCAENGKEPLGVSPKAMALLQNYDWPGNVRELRNVIEAAVVMSSGRELTPQSLPERMRQEAGASPYVRLRLGTTLRDTERELIRATLAANKGNRAKTARTLDIGRKTLYRKIEEYGLE